VYQIMGRYFDDFGSWHHVASWLAPNGVSNTAGHSWEPAVAIDGDGTFVIAWHDDTPGRSQIYVKRYDGVAVAPLGTGAASGNGVSQSAGTARRPAMAIDSANRPVVAWTDTGSGRAQIYVRRFEDGEWREMGASSATAGGVSNSGATKGSPELAAADGFICLVWSETGASSSEIVLRCAAE
jgi:hypothetical protein